MGPGKTGSNIGVSDSSPECEAETLWLGTTSNIRLADNHAL